jgi:D-amino-acid dehydrogenase
MAAPPPPQQRSTIDRVAVVGGGVVGLSVAQHLRAAGVEVVVLERDRVGSGASRGNAGEVCAGMVAPLAAPGVIADALRGLRHGGGALRLRPQLSTALARFLVGFAWSAREAPFARGVRALAALGGDAVGQYRELQAAGVEMHPNERPYLYIHGSRVEAEAAREHLQRSLAAADDLFGPVMNADELRRLEPCLAGDVAGYEVHGQMTLDPSALVDSLTAHLRATGAQIREGTRATAIATGPSGPVVHTSGGAVDADAVVLASGVWSAQLAATVGARLPIVPGKGYSFNVPIDRRPEHLLAIEAAHVHMAPVGGTTRVTGMIDFDLQHDRFDRRQIDAIVSAARPFVHGAGWEALSAEWVGPRPMTPDGLPMIGALPGAAGVFVAAGHNMLGVTLAQGSGRALAQLITSGRAEIDLEPFAPTRWRWR